MVSQVANLGKPSYAAVAPWGIVSLEIQTSQASELSGCRYRGEPICGINRDKPSE
jgi:hypothetical protein